MPAPSFTARQSLAVVFPLRGLQSAPNVSHYPVWKPSSSSDSFLLVHASMETWYFIFHSGLWMSLQVDAGSHATARPLPLIGLTATNRGRWTNERNIGRFHGNCHRGPRCPVLLLAVKITCDYFVCFLLQFSRDNSDQAEVHGSVCGLEEFWDLKP